MSNYLAIATVTATIQKILQDAVQADLEGARVTTLRPDNVNRGIPETGVNIFLYQVTPVNWRNSDLPGKRSTGELSKRPQIALDLNYILSFYGNEVELEPQRLLGTVVRTFYSRPILPSEVMKNIVEDSSFWYLRDSDLAEQIESIKFVPLSFSTEDLSKIWSVFFQTPLALSLGYQASVVLIESDEIPRRALPVREFRVSVRPDKPIIDRILSQDELTKIWRSSPEHPIVSTSTLKLQGHFVAGTLSKVKLGKADITTQPLSNKEIVVDLSSVSGELLRAGINKIKVIHYGDRGEHLIESNILPLVLFPTIKEIQVRKIKDLENKFLSVEISIVTSPTIGKNQIVELILNQLENDKPQEYIFKIPPRDQDSSLVQTVIQEIKPGDYLVRVQVDEVESLLKIDGNNTSENHNKYIEPKITIV